MKYTTLSKKIQRIRLSKQKMQISFKKQNNNGIWCNHSIRYPNFNSTIYDIENILLEYPESVVKLATYNIITDEVEDDILLLTHLDRW